MGMDWKRVSWFFISLEIQFPFGQLFVSVLITNIRKSLFSELKSPKVVSDSGICPYGHPEQKGESRTSPFSAYIPLRKVQRSATETGLATRIFVVYTLKFLAISHIMGMGWKRVFWFFNSSEDCIPICVTSSFQFRFLLCFYRNPEIAFQRAEITESQDWLRLLSSQTSEAKTGENNRFLPFLYPSFRPLYPPRRSAASSSVISLFQRQPARRVLIGKLNSLPDTLDKNPVARGSEKPAEFFRNYFRIARQLNLMRQIRGRFIAQGIRIRPC
jgi:hypothetical protein